MGYLYTATLPGASKSKFAAVATRFVVVEISTDPIERALKRRIAVCRDCRRAAALSPGNDEDFAKWKRECDRGEKLSRALIAHLSRRA